LEKNSKFKKEKINMKRITAFMTALFLVLGIAATNSFAQDDMMKQNNTMTKQRDTMMSKKTTMSKKTMMKKNRNARKHRKNHSRHSRSKMMMKKSTMK